MRCWLGIDPGKNGAIACITAANDLRVLKHLGEYEDAVLIGWICQLLQDGLVPANTVVEKVHSSPQMGVKSAFTFGEQFARVCFLVAAAGLPHRLVSPQKWQKTLGCMTGGDKNLTKAFALDLFPNHKATHADSDAICIAEYARRTE